MTLLTEDEAKRRWCPFARVEANPAEDISATVNRVHTGEPKHAARCIGSACMAWRWGQKRNPDWKPSDYQMMAGWPAPHPDDKPATHITDTEHGFCGLAGRPS